MAYQPLGRWKPYNDSLEDNLSLSSLSNALVVQNEANEGSGGVAAATNDSKSASKSSERMKSLDAFRGLVIIVMIYVDNAGGAYSGVLGHIGWNGVHFGTLLHAFHYTTRTHAHTNTLHTHTLHTTHWHTHTPTLTHSHIHTLAHPRTQ